MAHFTHVKFYWYDFSIKKLFPEIFQNGLGAGANLQLFVNITDVSADGFNTDGEGSGNLLIKESLCQEPENLLLPLGQVYGGIRFY